MDTIIVIIELVTALLSLGTVILIVLVIREIRK